ncbi:phage tail assembly chaperone GT [Aerococcus urinaeequi]|uniref:phage tail assembly chaperone GT n=1 Tax=Aerococcus urinaeequi TaxID=51665 RepID=UPI003B3AF992
MGGKKVTGEESLSDEDFSYEKQIEFIDKIVLDFYKNGKDINEVLDMPFHYLLGILEEENKPQEAESLMSAFT